MPIPGYLDYQRREYCRDISCPVQLLLERQEPQSDSFEKVREICKSGCIHTTWEFHHWLTAKGYTLVRPEK